MALSTNYGSGAQASEAVSLSLYPWQYTDAFRTSSDNGSSSRITDIVGPLDKPTSIKTVVTRIANVYQTLAGGSIPIANQSLNVTGQTTFCELTTILSKAATETSPETMYPVQARVELRLPNTAELTETDVLNLTLAAFAGLCDDKGIPVVITERMRGALTPAGI